MLQGLSDFKLGSNIKQFFDFQLCFWSYEHYFTSMKWSTRTVHGAMEQPDNGGTPSKLRKSRMTGFWMMRSFRRNDRTIL